MHYRKSPISKYDVDIKKIVVSNKVSFGKKFLYILLVTKMIKNRPLYLMLPKNKWIQKIF